MRYFSTTVLILLSNGASTIFSSKHCFCSFFSEFVPCQVDFFLSLSLCLLGLEYIWRKMHEKRRIKRKIWRSPRNEQCVIVETVKTAVVPCPVGADKKYLLLLLLGNSV